MANNIEIRFVDELPERRARSYQPFIQAARANPMRWIELPWENSRGKSDVSTAADIYKGIEVRSIDRKVFIRSTVQTEGLIHTR